MEDLVKQLKAFEEDTNWLFEHYDELKHTYAEEFVAVLGKKVVDHDPDLRRLMGRLRQKYPKEANRAAVEYVSKKKLEYVL